MENAYYFICCITLTDLPTDTTNSQAPAQIELKTFLSPMSLASMTSTHSSPYSEGIMQNYPRLTAPRDLQIPGSQYNANVKVRRRSSCKII